VPGTYTVTFTRSDLAQATVSVTLAANGTVSGGSGGVRISRNSIQTTLSPATGTVVGTVTQPVAGRTGNGLPVGGATVTLTAGETTYAVSTATTPAGARGSYRVDGVAPGTYTLTVSAGSGTSPKSQVIVVHPGRNVAPATNLAMAASLTVLVQEVKPHNRIVAPRRWSVFVYASADYPGGAYRPGQVFKVDSAVDQNGRTVRPASRHIFNDVDAGQYVIAVGPTPDAANAEVTKFVTVHPSEQAIVVIRAKDVLR
jgi:hypothetical protein